MYQKKLGFGFMRLPLIDSEKSDSVNFEILNNMVDMFLAKGFTYFDTAYMYHGFKSEIALRESLVKRHPRDSFKVATKLPTMSLKQAEDVERIFHEQLEKCGVEYFDYYLLHNINVENYEVAKKFGAFEFIQRKKAEGKIVNIGFSYHDSAELLDSILTEHPEVDFVQIQLNYLDWNNASIQSGACYEVIKKHGKPVIVMEPLKGGALANVPKPAEDLFKKYAPDMSVASWGIRFAANLEDVMIVLSGMSNLKQLEDNVKYMENFSPLNKEEKKLIEEAVGIINSSIAIQCTACQYCVSGCPQNIAIPRYFALYNMEKQNPSTGFSLSKLYYSNYTKQYGKASDCIECGNCESSCPQHLNIINYLKDVKEMLE